MATVKIAVVTGGNKGIGYAIVKGLCERFDGKVYLTARDTKRGLQAVEELGKLGLHPIFHQLDITNQSSIDGFKEYIIKEHGGIDLLVNNAAIGFLPEATDPIIKQAKETIEVNYFSLLRVCVSLFPLLRNNARVVNVSSAAGHLSRIPSLNIRKKFSDPALTVPQLNNLMNQFVKDVIDGKHVEAGWGNAVVCYIVSKVGVCALTVIQQREFDREQPNRNISVNSVHPGYVDTDLNAHRGHLTTEEGARAPLYLSLENHNLKGKYIWFDSTTVDWCADKTPTPL